MKNKKGNLDWTLQPFLSEASPKAHEPPLVLEPRRFKRKLEVPTMAVRVRLSPSTPPLFFFFFFSHSPSIPWVIATCCNSSFFVLICCLLLKLQQKRQTWQRSPLPAFSSSLAATATMPPTTRLIKGTHRAYFSLQIGTNGQVVAVAALTATVNSVLVNKIETK